MRERGDSKKQLETVLAFLLPVSGIFKNLFYLKLFFSIMKHQGISLIHVNKQKNNAQLLTSLK